MPPPPPLKSPLVHPPPPPGGGDGCQVNVQPFKVCYSRTQKFFIVPLDPCNIRVA